MNKNMLLDWLIIDIFSTLNTHPFHVRGSCESEPPGPKPPNQQLVEQQKTTRQSYVKNDASFPSSRAKSPRRIVGKNFGVQGLHDLAYRRRCPKNLEVYYSKKSPTGPTERTPKSEYLIALATYLGVRW